MTIDDMAEYGLDRMGDDELRDFLANQKMGVLGLPTASAPYLLPMSFGYDGDSSLYFTFVGGPDSRKRTHIDAADRVRFLTYAAQSMFNWESAILTGTVEPVPEDEWDDLAALLGTVWRPEVFERAKTVEDVVIYRFVVEEWSGIKHTGLPPGFEAG
jgi:nitroimidazol reductase NimA-like FMN-containing flavoprotein (pyridoxamine 5'-phosphate oxidase superfamily)